MRSLLDQDHGQPGCFEFLGMPKATGIGTELDRDDVHLTDVGLDVFNFFWYVMGSEVTSWPFDVIYSSRDQQQEMHSKQCCLESCRNWSLY